VNCNVASGTTITCTTPSFTTAGTTSLVVTNVDGSAATLPFTYTASTPFTTAGTGTIYENGGSTNGGNFVTITGSDFAAGATVRVGGVPAYKVQVVDSQTIQALMPAGSAGTQTVLVTNPSGASGTVPGGYDYGPGAGINFVQANSGTSNPNATSQAVTFALPQTAGDLNVVVAGWGDTLASIKSVTDTAGNTYAIAAAAVQGTNLTQAIYYAKNINNSASNTVTVTFNEAAAFPDVRIAEYSGLDIVNPLDAGGGAAGAGTDIDSGPVTLTSAGDLFIGAADVGDIVTLPGNGFVTVIVTGFGNNVEHTFPNGAGAIDATATQGDGDAWVMQGVGFRQPAGTLPGFTVGATALSPVSIAPGGSATSTVTITATDGFANMVNLTCTGLPTGGVCNFLPPFVTPGASPVTSALTITTTSGTPVGTSTVTITGTSGSVISTAPVTLVVVAAGSGNFTLTATPASQTVAAGTSGTSTIAVVPTGGFNGTVNLTCSITTPASPAPVCSVTASATPTAPATLTVSTTAATAAVRHSSNIFYAMLLPIGGMTLLGVGFGSRRKKVLGVTLVFLMVSGLLFLAACGGGSSSSGGGGGGGTSGTPAGNYTVTVTGTSAPLTAQTTTFTLTVQ
jgi:hypothetical protein